MKKFTLLVLAFALIIFTGCSQLKPGVEKYTVPEPAKTAEESEVDTEVKSIIERLAEQEHIVPELSDDFVSRYFDMGSFNELKERTVEGIAATKEMADLTEKEYKLWSDIINSARLNQYTVDDLKAKEQELNGILADMATEKQLSLKEMMKVDYDMQIEEMNAFIEKQSKKYLHKTGDTVTEEQEESEDGTEKQETLLP